MRVYVFIYVPVDVVGGLWLWVTPLFAFLGFCEHGRPGPPGSGESHGREEVLSPSAPAGDWKLSIGWCLLQKNVNDGEKKVEKTSIEKKDISRKQTLVKLELSTNLANELGHDLVEGGFDDYFNMFFVFRLHGIDIIV